MELVPGCLYPESPEDDHSPEVGAAEVPAVRVRYSTSRVRCHRSIFPLIL